jgi:hypothetical protein
VSSSSFPSIRIEGGLLGPDALDQLMAAELPGQRPADFGLDAKRNLTDEIAAVFADARALWGVFQHRRERLPEGDPGTTVTRDAWMVPFLGLLGYELCYNPKAHEVDGLTFAISHSAAFSASPRLEVSASDFPPVHIVGAGQELGRVPQSGRPRLAPHSLVQEYLNRTEHVWGLVTNGLTLRLLRDCTLIRRQAYVEFDLIGILEEQRFHDFAALYRLLHRTRLPRGVADSSDCLLEGYYTHSLDQGGRVRDRLRDGVEEAIRRFANGILTHPASEELRSDLCSGRLSVQDFLRELLRLIYRLLFLMVSEERGLLSKDPTYRQHYSVSRLRGLVDVRSAYTEHEDLWLGLRILFRVLQDERFGSLLGLPALNGELFAPLRADGASIRNHDLLAGVWHLSNYEDSGSVRRVNYAALDVEELGSVYESLLELHPHLDLTAAPPTFDFVRGGHERRSTGSHYTPPELVAPLTQHALEPVLAERLRSAATREQKERAILAMKVCDLACGSGHILLAAARRLGKELARVRTGEDEPAPEPVREATRDVIAHCIYGVDKNPLAVDLCRVALWLESQVEGKPLTFLDHRIRCGDSLVGVFDLAVLERGIPDEAFKPVAGDDKAAAREAKRRNAAERAEALLQFPVGQQLQQFAAQLREIDELPEDTAEQIRAKAEAYRRIEQSPDFQKLQLACDVWTAALFQSFPNPSGQALTTEVLRTTLASGRVSDARIAGSILQTAGERRFFHWPLAFPEVLAAGGFDVFLGNPPFVGGQRIRSEFGDKYRNLLTTIYAPFIATADLCAAFFRRAADAVKRAGRFGLIATNTISQGDTRLSGLTVLVRRGDHIQFADRFVKWPGMANVEVNLISVQRGCASTPRVLDGVTVDFISSRLDCEAEVEPQRLIENRDRSFQGSNVVGVGFTLEPTAAQRLIEADARNRECLLPYLNGKDLNSQPSLEPTRWIINFFDWPLERAEQYPDLLRIVRERVKPERDRNRRDNYRERWWIHGENRPGLYAAIRGLRRVLLRARLSEFHMMALIPSCWVYSEQTVVFAFDDYFHFTLLQSNVHEAWVWKNASSLESRNRYTPTDCFETFPFPQSPPATARAEAERIGEDYHEHRRQIMLARQLGLTKAYNLVHNPECTDADIVRLRELHSAMDRAILACYGWSDLDPGHGFHKNERGQTRYTVSPTARRELLRRLLGLNLDIWCTGGHGLTS